MYDYDLELLLLEEELFEEATDVEKAESQLITLMQHMLKHQYQPERQGKSWCDSIGDSYNEYNEIINRKPKRKTNIINGIDLDRCYEEARKDAIKQIKKSNIPKTKPEEWDIDYITNYDNIISFLRDEYNPNATYNFDSEEDMVDFMKGKLR